MSHAVIDSVKLKALCDNVSETVFRERSNRKRKATQEELSRLNNQKKRWFKKPKIWTYEEVDKYLEDRWRTNNNTMWPDFKHPWHVNRAIVCGTEALEIAKKLSNACQVASHVTVTADDLEYLIGWSDEEVRRQIFGEHLYRDAILAS